MFANYEKDYIMKQVKNLVRAILKLFFKIDTFTPIEEIIKQAEEKEFIEELLLMADEGKICQAENKIFDMTADKDMHMLKAALIFYYKLSEKSENFLKENNFSSEEIKEGVAELAERYKINDLSSVFLN